MRKSLIALVCSTALCCQPVAVHAAAATGGDVYDLSLEQLKDLEVTSVSKKREKAKNAPAAVYVITSEDIKRMGATTIPEALKVVPGIQVSQIDSNKWAISSRGFTNQFSNKLLVLMDGRSVYSPIFSGTYWDAQDTLLEDVDRIEVIRGPGATLWGANAVNGVINIITKSAEYTQGNYASATYGTRERGTLEGRMGRKSGDNLYYRTYAKTENRSSTTDITGRNNYDGWTRNQAGFRVDADNAGENGKSNGTVQGDIYYAGKDTRFEMPSTAVPYSISELHDEENSGGNVLARWNEHVSDTSNYTVQAYIDHVRRNERITNQEHTTLDVDTQYNFQPTETHDITVGAGYRRIYDSFDGGEFIALYDDKDNYDLWSAFVQDEITLSPELLYLTLGTKVELNEFNGANAQPGIRMTWTPNDTNTFWASVARANRTPSRVADGVDAILRPVPANALYAGSPAALVRILGNTQLNDERLTAYELGYRVQPRNDVNIDIATFYNDYTKLFTVERGTPFINSSTSLGSYLEVPIQFDERAKGSSYGFELAASWRVLPQWMLSGGYSYIQVDVDPEVGSTDSSQISAEGNTPDHMFNLRSNLNLPHGWQWDNMLYYVTEIDAQDYSSALHVDGYSQLDSRLGWRYNENLEFSILAKYLLDDKHPEFTAPVYGNSAEIDRSIYGQIRLTY